MGILNMKIEFIEVKKKNSKTYKSVQFTKQNCKIVN